MLPATLHNFIGTYEWALDTKNKSLVLLENKCPLQKACFSYFVSN